MTRIGPRIDVQTNGDRTVTTVDHRRQRLICDGCGREMGRPMIRESGDWCSAQCYRAYVLASVEPEPRDYRFAMQPSLLPKIATETTEHATVEWREQPDGRTVRVVSWAQPGVQPVASPWPPDGALEQWAESGWAQSIYSLVGESGPELCLPGRVGNVLPKNPWIDPTTGRELSR